MQNANNYAVKSRIALGVTNAPIAPPNRRHEHMNILKFEKKFFNTEMFIVNFTS